MQKFLSYLRITWSLWWGLLALLLIVLCVRSYWVSDIVVLTTPTCDAKADSASGGTNISVFVDSEREVATEWIRKSYGHNAEMQPPNAFWEFGIRNSEFTPHATD